MRTRLIVGLAIVALVVTASVMINAAPRGRMGAGGPGPGMRAPGPGPWCPLGGGPMLGRLAKTLGLTETQIADLKKLHQEFFDQTKATREEIQTKAKEMVNLWMADPPDAAAIKALAGEIDTLRVEIRNAGIDHMISALNVLTPAQREKLRTIVKEKGGMFLGHMGCGFCFGPGLGCGMGMGRGPGMGGGMGPGWGTGTGPRGGTPACPLTR